MKKLFSLAALLFVAVLAFNGVAFGWGSTGGDATNYRQLQETAVFMNNAGANLSVGDVVCLEAGYSNVSNGNLGCNVTIINGSDSVLAVGVVRYDALDVTPVVVVTKGPALTYIADLGDAVTNATAVGTSPGLANKPAGAWAGGGTNLGIALEAGDGTDGDQIMVWVDPTGAD